MNASQSADQILIPTELPEQLEPTETREPEFGIGAEKVFSDYNPNQIRLLPQDLSEWVPAGHLARLVDDLVETVLNLTPIYASYKVAQGAPPR